MGLISAALGSVGGVLAEQWKEYFYCEALPETVLVTKNHYALRFKTSDISLYKKTSVGVRGLKLEPDDEITDVYDFDPSGKYVVRIGKKAVDLGKLKLKKRDQKPDLIK